jgi:hypothetical protein
VKTPIHAIVTPYPISTDFSKIGQPFVKIFRTAFDGKVNGRKYEKCFNKYGIPSSGHRIPTNASKC